MRKTLTNKSPIKTASSTRASSLRSSNLNNKRTITKQTNHNNMRKENIFPLIAGIVLGVLVMIFWQFTARQQVITSRLLQLEQVTAQNTQAINDVVSFINEVTSQNNANGSNVNLAE